MKIWSLILAAALLVVGTHADAKRMGGGGSFGKQSGNVTQRQAAPATPAAPVQNAAKPATPAPATPPAAAPRSLGAPCWAVWPRVWAWPGWLAA